MKSIKFSTIDDFSEAEIRKNKAFRALYEVQYCVSAFCKYAGITQLVWRVKEHKSLVNARVDDVIARIEKAIIKYINKQENISERLKRRYIADIRQACSYAKEDL